MVETKDRRLLLIGWDAADWKAIHPLMDRGLLPNLERLVNEGVSGRLSTLQPALSPMLWTSIATGKRPYKHGILGFTELAPDGKTIQAVTNVHRRVKAIWNILHQSGKRSNVLGWWPSHPAEPINGVMVSNFYQRALKEIQEPWPMRDGTVHPKELSGVFEKLRVHPAELTAAHMAPFVPRFMELGTDEQKPLVDIARCIADAATVHAAATWVMEHKEWDFMAVYHDSIDHIKHGFMRYHPPRQPHVPEEGFERFREVVTSGYRFHDMMLGRLLDLAGADTTVMLISDHGFHPDHLRPAALPKEPAAPALEHSPYGIFCLKGPGIRKDAIVHGASLLDITPTLLTLFGLPIAQDMDGRPLLEVFEKAPQPVVIPSWEDVPGECGMHPDPARRAAEIDMDPNALAQLVELGYVEEAGGDQAQASIKTIRENRFFLGQAYMDGGRVDEAIAEFQKVHGEAPERTRYCAELMNALLKATRVKEARAVYERTCLAQERKHEQERAAALAKDPAERDPGPYEPHRVLKLQEISLLVAEQELGRALAKLEVLMEHPRLRDALQLRLGNILTRMGRWDKAYEAFTNAALHDPEAWRARHGQAICALRSGRYHEAVQHLHDALGLKFDEPLLHYHLGEAYFKLEQMDKAATAFEVSLRMMPSMNKARMRLALVLRDHLGRPKDAEAILGEVSKHTLGASITIVSGLPRSGTSMMMQAIVAGGMEPFIDDKRQADESNPKGYFEHSAVKSLHRDARFMANARGKLVKVVAPLLPFLPDRFEYNIVFMDRNLDEVLASQNTMIDRAGRVRTKGAYRVGLEEAFKADLEKVEAWAARRPNVRMLRIGHAQVMNDPAAIMAKVAAFIGAELDLEAMAAVVDPALYRARRPVDNRMVQG